MKTLTTLTVREDAGLERRAWPVTRGIPLPRGTAADAEALRLQDPRGRGVPLQGRALSRWPDGSIKWVLVDFQAGLPASGEAVYSLCSEVDEDPPAPEHQLEIHEDDGRLVVCTGPLRFSVARQRYGLLQHVELGDRSAGGFAGEVVVASDAGDAWAGISEASPVEGARRRIYGMGGTCRASLAQGLLPRSGGGGRAAAGGDPLRGSPGGRGADAPLRRVPPLPPGDADPCLRRPCLRAGAAHRGGRLRSAADRAAGAGSAKSLGSAGCAEIPGGRGPRSMEGRPRRPGQGKRPAC